MIGARFERRSREKNMRASREFSMKGSWKNLQCVGVAVGVQTASFHLSFCSRSDCCRVAGERIWQQIGSCVHSPTRVEVSCCNLCMYQEHWLEGRTSLPQKKWLIPKRKGQGYQANTNGCGLSQWSSRFSADPYKFQLVFIH